MACADTRCKTFKDDFKIALQFSDMVSQNDQEHVSLPDGNLMFSPGKGPKSQSFDGAKPQDLSLMCKSMHWKPVCDSCQASGTRGRRLHACTATPISSRALPTAINQAFHIMYITCFTCKFSHKHFTS